MPVEIRELVIRATVSPSNASNTPRPHTSKSHQGPLSIGGNDALIQACVSQVMQLLEKQKER